MAVLSYDYVESGYFESGYISQGIDILWGTSVIFVARAALTLVQTTPVEIRELSITDLHDSLRNHEDSEHGIAYSKTHTYSGTTLISGVTLAQVLQIDEPYTLTFEDGQWAVNIVDGNSNVGDKVNINNVGVRIANSAGLVVVEVAGGGGSTPQEIWEYGTRDLTSDVGITPQNVIDIVDGVWTYTGPG
jgi:hypothetical protein